MIIVLIITICSSSSTIVIIMMIVASINKLETNCISCRLSPTQILTPAAASNILLCGWKTREGKESLGNCSSDQEREAKAFYCSLVKMEGARLNSSVTADRLLYFSVFRSFGSVTLAALAISWLSSCPLCFFSFYHSVRKHLLRIPGING
jgi:hypothetical protein